MSSSNSFFQISKPVGKCHFLSAYDDTIAIALLLLVPFGVSSSLTDLLAGNAAEEELTALYKSWEDVISRKVYAWRGIPDERVSATLHKFLESDQDEEVIDTIRKAQMKIRTIINPDEIIDMTPSDCNSCKYDYNICTPKVVAELVDNVLTALNSMLAVSSNVIADRNSNKSIFATDSNLWNIFGIQVPLRNFQPHETLAQNVFSEQGLRLLQNALIVTVPESVYGASKAVKVSLDQYYTLLEIFGNSAEVSQVIEKHFGKSPEGCVNSQDLRRNNIDELRAGSLSLSFMSNCLSSTDNNANELNCDSICNFLPLLVHPTASYVQQLKFLIAYSAQRGIIVENTSSCIADSLSTSQRRLIAAELGIKLVRDALRLKGKAKMAGEMGDIDRAIGYISAALNGAADEIDQEEEAEQLKADKNTKDAKRNAGDAGRKGNKKNGKKAKKAKQAFENMFEMFANNVFDTIDEDYDEDDVGEDLMDDEDEELDGMGEDDDPLQFMFGQGRHHFHNEDDEDNEDDVDDDDDEDDGDEDDGDEDEDDANEKSTHDEKWHDNHGFEGWENHDQDESQHDQDYSNIEDDEYEHDDMEQIHEIEARINRIKLQKDIEKDRVQQTSATATATASAPVTISKPETTGTAAHDNCPAAAIVASSLANEDTHELEIHSNDEEPIDMEDISCHLDCDKEAVKDSHESSATIADHDAHDDNDAVPEVDDNNNTPNLTDIAAASQEASVPTRSILSSLGYSASQLLPVHLKVTLHFTRAQYHLEGGHLDEALDDCKSALELDPRHAPSHALRASIIASLLSIDELKQDGEENEAIVDGAHLLENKPEMLHNAARDALAAFLLSGCSDLEMAGAAEDAAREACRLDAKSAFATRNTHSTSSDTHSTDYLPKPWLLQSFLNGYELLSEAFTIDWDMIHGLDLEEFPETRRVFRDDVPDNLHDDRTGYSNVNFDYLLANQSTESMDDIDDDSAVLSKIQSAMAESSVAINLNLPFPPHHLRDSNIETTFSSSSSSSASASSEESLFTPESSTILHNKDPEAYILVCKLVSILDHAADNAGCDIEGLFDIETLVAGAEAISSDIDIFEDAKEYLIDFPKLAASEEELLAFSNEKSTVDDACILLAQGKLEYFDEATLADDKSHLQELKMIPMDENESKSINNKMIRHAAQLASDIADLVRATDELAEQGLRSTSGIASTTSAANTATPAVVANQSLLDVATIANSACCHPSKAFIEALRLLRLKVSESITGVRFCENGSIGSCEDVQLLTNLNNGKGDDVDDDDDDDAWEDCDDDEEDDEEAENTNEKDESVHDEITFGPGTKVAQTIGILRSRVVSFALQARLLSICSSLAYLAGDSTGAVKCLRNALVAARNAIELHKFASSSRTESETVEAEECNMTTSANGSMLVDTLIKLASLLTDMDEVKEAKKLFIEADQCAPQIAFVALHFAELEIHSNHFSEAISLLRKAKRLTVYNSRSAASTMESKSNLHKNSRNHTNLCLSLIQKKAANNNNSSMQQQLERIQRAQLNLQASIYSLLGVALFRQNPTRPDLALMELQEGVESFPRNLYLQMCLGEVLSQAGDAVGAMKAFQEASKLDPMHPLPYVNAARTYQQLNQKSQAMKHITRGIAVDPTLAMTRVDLAQQYLHSGQSSKALETLNEALVLARHVSEIRDVLTAKNVAMMQLELETEGLYTPQLLS